MRKETSTTVSIILVSFIFLVSIPMTTADSTSQPQLPHAFYGIVESGGSVVGEGLVVEAIGPGVVSHIAGNPVTTLSDGAYGAADFTSQKLLVQGDIAPGARLDFYVGGSPAEVYDVAAGGPWKANYSFRSGEITELRLRVASVPAAGQTREPTPVQTIESISGAAASTAPGSGAASGGALLPQLPDSTGQQQPTAEGTYQAPEDNPQAGVTGQGAIPQGASQQSGGQESEAGPVNLPATGNMTLYIAAGILLLLVIVGGVYYYTNQKKSETGENKETGKKEE
jgi:LPXTG-motif cell wall-anchored protein